MAVPLNPSVRFTLLLAKVPASAGTNTYRWSNRPLADAGAFAQGRVLKYGTVDRKLSTPDGDYDIATTDVEITDADGLIRGLLSEVATRYFTSREAALELLSEAGRAAGLQWRTIMRGRVTDIQASPGRKARIRISDEVGSHFSGFDLEKELGVRITRREHPNAEDDVVNRVYPIITGEHTDVKVVDENGAPADKGLLPVIDVGNYLLDEDGDVHNDVPFAYLTAPTNLAGVVNGTPGTTTHVYGVTAVSPYGETTLTTLEVTTAPALKNGTDNVALTWDAQPGTVEFRVYRDGKLLARLNNDETFTDPETTYTDDGTNTTSGVTPPATNSAQVDQVLGDGSTVSGWARLILKIGAAAEVQHMYASDLGSPPKRVRVTEDLYGSEFMVYGRSGWPHANPYIEINGIRMGVAYARGPRLEHHRNNTITITWNGCGDDDVGDGSGETITEAFKALQHVLNEYVLKDAGLGYLTGLFGPLELYSNGVAKLKTSAFAAMQALTVDWIGGVGYLASIAITEPISLREFLRRFNVTFASHMASNHHGQMFPVLVDDTADPTAGRHYRDRIEVRTFESQDIDHDAVETKVTYHFQWDADAQEFRVADQVIEDADASQAYFAPRERSVRQCYYTQHEATAKDSNARHLTRYKVAPRYVSFKTNLLGLEDEVGSQIRLTHYDGAGGPEGDVATPMLVVGHRTDPNAPESVTLTCLDLARILATPHESVLQDETTMTVGNLGDETSPALPPTGAFELNVSGAPETTEPPPANPGSGTQYFVAANGNNGDPGTVEQPFATIQFALGQLGPGDTLTIRGGTWAEFIRDAYFSSGGSAGNPITVQGYPGETVILKPSSGSIGNVLGIDASSGLTYLTFKDLILDGSSINTGGDQSGEAVAYVSTDRVRFERVTTQNGGGNGMLLYGDSHYLLDCKWLSNGWGTYGASNGLYAGYVTNTTVKGGFAYNNENYGIRVYQSGNAAPNPASGNIVDGVLCVQNGYRRGLNGTSNASSGGGGIVVGDDDLVVMNCFLHSNYWGLQDTNDSATATNIRIINNTIAFNDNGMSIWGSLSGTFTARNNIIVMNIGVQFDTSFGNASITQSHNITAGTVDFVSGAGRNLRLAPTAVNAINQGTTVAEVTTDHYGTARPQGAAYDIGAHEVPA